MSNQKNSRRDLTRRSHSYRNYLPEEFIQYSLTENGKIDRDKYGKARETFRSIEDGRFFKMIYRVHLFFSALDTDEKELWKERNPELIEWIGVYGFIEVMNTFEKFTGIPSFHEFDVLESE